MVTDYCKHFLQSFWQERTQLPTGQLGCAALGPGCSPCCWLGSFLAFNSPKGESEKKESRSPLWTGKVNVCVGFIARGGSSAFCTGAGAQVNTLSASEQGCTLSFHILLEKLEKT